MSNNQDLIFLSEEDLIKLGVLDMKNCISVMEETFRLVGKGDYIMGGPRENEHGQKLYFPVEDRFPGMPTASAERRFMSMIAYLGGDFNVCGMKWYGSNALNFQKGLPRSILLSVLNDVETGAPLAIMSANTISAMRTGAMAGLGAKYLTNSKGKVLAIIGAGVIGKTSLIALLETVSDVEEVKIYDVFKDKSLSLIDDLKHKYNVKFTVSDSKEEAIKNSDIINIAASRIDKPYIKHEWIKEGAMLSLPAAVDLDKELLLNSTIVVDEWKMHQAHKVESEELEKDDPRGFDLATSFLFDLIESGEMKEESISSLGSIITNDASDDAETGKTKIFITGGLPVQDVAWSYHLYQKSLKEDIGQKIKLWDKPTLI